MAMKEAFVTLEDLMENFANRLKKAESNKQTSPRRN